MKNTRDLYEIWILGLDLTEAGNWCGVSLYQRGSYCMGITIFNSLPLRLKQLYKDVKHFKSALKEFLCCHPFYTLTEYFEYSNRKD
jgi:hypothetical protein